MKFKTIEGVASFLANHPERRDPRAIVKANPAAFGKGTELIYGVLGDQMLFFLESTYAQERAYTHKVLYESKTWKEFKANVSSVRYEEALEMLEWYGALEFSAYYDEVKSDNPESSDEEIKSMYYELPVGERFPKKEDEFDRELLGPSHIWPSWPAYDMPDWVPEEIQDAFECWCNPMNEDAYMHFDPEQEGEVVAEFERYGFRCNKDDGLIKEAFGW